VGEFEGEVLITADPSINALIIVASPKDYDALKKVIAKLDIRRPQVFVEAAIVEIRYDKNFDWNFEFRQVKSVLEQGEGKAVFGGFNNGGIEQLQAAIGSGQGGLPAGVIFGAADGTINFGGVELPNIGVLLKFLESTTDVNILSTPQILTTANEDAEIVIGQNIPFPTGSVYSSYSGTPSLTVDRQDVGITLQITPQINESDYITLMLFHEITSVAKSPSGLDVAQVGITTAVRSAETTIIAKDGQTTVIGGLISDEVSEAESKVPVLGDIPILGFFFKSHGNMKRKVNLLIFITPHIIRTPEDIYRITKDRSDYMRGEKDKVDLGLDPKESKRLLDIKPPPPEKKWEGKRKNSEGEESDGSSTEDDSASPNSGEEMKSGETKDETGESAGSVVPESSVKITPP
jgi:general secretion pathway protein D